MAVATTWRPVYTASTWSTLWAGMHDTMASRAPGVDAPPLTNAEAVAFIREWRDVSHSGSPLWFQFAAVAYGWNPQKRDTLTVNSKQAARWYPLVADLWQWARGIARELDERHDSQPPRIAVDRGTFTDPVFLGNVRARLMEDGATAAFKIPSGACRDTSSGKTRYPRAPCDKNGRGPLIGYKNGRAVYAPCDKPGDCESEYFDDPITVAIDRVSTLLLMVGAVWLFTRPTRRGRRN